MDLYRMELLKCEPEVIVKYEPLFTENSPDYTECCNVNVNNNNLVKTECESVSFSSNCGFLSDDIITQDCKCSFCMRKQVATLLPTTSVKPEFTENSCGPLIDDVATFLPNTNISASIKPAFKEESVLAASEHSQKNTSKLKSTRNSTSCNQTRQPKPQTKTQHFCPYCHQYFTRRDSLSIHLRRKHSERHSDFLIQKCNKEFTCEICKFKSSCSRSLKSHMLTHETFVDTKKIFKCNNCDYETSRKLRIRMHIQCKHSNDRTTYSCRFCGKTLFSKDALGDHLLCKHGEKFEKTLKTLFSRTIKHCNLCDFRTITKFKVARHMRKHGYGQRFNNKKRNPCTFCNKTYSSQTNLTDHLFAHHYDKFDKSSNDQTTYSCRFCAKPFLRKVSLSNHLLCHHGEKFDKSLKTLLSRTINHCKLCDFRITCKYLLDQHIRAKHSNDRPTYSCRFCNKTFAQRTSLADHLLLHHGDKFDKSLNTLFSRTIKHCKLCDFRTITKSLLDQHMTKHGHSITNKRIYKCINCDYETIRKCHLRFHIQKKHSNAKPTNSCRFCSKTFFYKISLAHHLLGQHDEKVDKSLKTLCSMTIKYCKLCDFRTMRKDVFHQHIAKHGDSMVNAGTDKITYKCNNCDYETFKRHNLQVHINRKHSNDKNVCMFCNTAFIDKLSLAHHFLQQHGDKFDKSLKRLLSLTIKHCRLCDFRTVSKPKLIEHMITHGVGLVETDKIIFKCNNCDYETVKKWYLRVHIQNMHSSNRPRYSCRFCNKTFIKKETLADHLLRHHGEKIDKSLETLLGQTIKHCKLCDFRCIGENKLNRHIQTKHFNDNAVRPDSESPL